MSEVWPSLQITDSLKVFVVSYFPGVHFFRCPPPFQPSSFFFFCFHLDCDSDLWCEKKYDSAILSLINRNSSQVSTITYETCSQLHCNFSRFSRPLRKSSILWGQFVANFLRQVKPQAKLKETTKNFHILHM